LNKYNVQFKVIIFKIGVKQEMRMFMGVLIMLVGFAVFLTMGDIFGLVGTILGVWIAKFTCDCDCYQDVVE
jgi:type IV secretory pathway TrbD component